VRCTTLPLGGKKRKQASPKDSHARHQHCQLPKEAQAPGVSQAHPRTEGLGGCVGLEEECPVKSVQLHGRIRGVTNI